MGHAAGPRCRRLLSPVLALLLLTAGVQMPACGGPRLKGNSYVRAWCTSWAGMTFEAWTSNFLPRTRIKYVAEVWYDGALKWKTQSGWYTTNSIGNHFKWTGGQPNNSLECGSGTYSIIVWTQNSTGTYHTYSNGDEVACG